MHRQQSIVNRQSKIGVCDIPGDDFGKTDANVQYSNQLTQIIAENNFKNLTDEILREHPEILIRAAQSDRENFSGGLLNIFLQNEKIPQAKKNAVYGRLLKIADGADVKSAWILFGELSTIEPNIYSVRLTPLVEKQFAESVNFAKNYHKANEDDGDVSNLPQRYGAILFSVYLAANNRPAAEKLMVGKFYPQVDALPALLENAVRSGAFDEAMHYWKMKANLDRQDLDQLSYLKNFPALAQFLREFYAQMKHDEPNSPIPDQALKILK